MSNKKKVMIFIDGSNIFHSMTRKFGSSYRIDYAKLIEILVADRDLVRPYYYASEDIPPIQEQTAFYEKLRYLGVKVRIFPLKRRGTGKVEKGVDIALAADMLTLSFRNAYDVAILVSGDGDFLRIVEEVQRTGTRVEIASFEHSIGHDLRMSADFFHALNLMGPKIKLTKKQTKTPRK